MIQFLQNILHRLLGKEIDAKIREYFLKGSFQSLFLQSGLSLLTFLTSIVIARLAGDKGLGIYSLVFTWVSIVSVAATMGIDDLFLRQIPRYKDANNKKSIEFVLTWGRSLAFWGLLVVLLLYIAAIYFSGISGLSDYAEYHLWGALSIPFFVGLQVYQSALRGFGVLGEGQLAEKLLQPLAFLLFLTLAFVGGIGVSDLDAIIFRSISFVLAAFVAVWLLHKNLKKFNPPILDTAPVEENTKAWRKSCMFFMLGTMLYTLNTRVDIVFLGIYEVSPEQIAYYNVALKFSDIALIPFLVVCTVTAPMFSSLFHQGKIKELQFFYTKVTRLSTIAIASILTVFVVFGPWFLSWYGQSFQSGYPVLVLLCITKLVHVFVGPANYLLAMLGQERAVMMSLLGSVLFNVFLQILFVKTWGIVGAAYATLGGLLLFDIMVGWVAYRRTGIVVTALGKFLFVTKSKNH